MHALHLQSYTDHAVSASNNFWTLGAGAAVTGLHMLQGFLSDGLSYEPHRHVGWYNLGLLYKTQHRPEEAERCLRTAVGLSLTAPVMSFSKLPRLL